MENIRVQPSAQIVRDFWILTKPRLTQLVVLTSLCGAAVAPGSISLLAWISLLFGTWGIVASANMVNCVLERDVDIYMKRTQERSVILKRISPGAVLFAGLALAVLSLVTLKFGNSLLTMNLGALGFISYIALYTPLKRISFSALFVGAVPGAIPPMMGWAAVENALSWGAWILLPLKNASSCTVRWWRFVRASCRLHPIFCGSTKGVSGPRKVSALSCGASWNWDWKPSARFGGRRTNFVP